MKQNFGGVGGVEATVIFHPLSHFANISVFQMCHSQDRTNTITDILEMSLGSLWHQEKVLVKGLSEPMEGV